MDSVFQYGSFAPMTELVYVLVLEAKFWEFESLLGHQIASVEKSVNSEDLKSSASACRFKSGHSYQSAPVDKLW